MRKIVGVCVLVCTFGCKSSSKDGGSANGSGAAAGSPTSTSTVAGGGECKTVDVCAKFPIERIEKECGGGAVKVHPTHVDSDAYILDACEYQIANGASIAQLGRTCMTAKGGGAGVAGQMFDMNRNEKKGDRVVENDAPGVGGKAYYRTQDRYVRLNAIKGNLLLEAASSGDKDEAAKKQCLLALMNDLIAL